MADPIDGARPARPVRAGTPTGALARSPFTLLGSIGVLGLATLVHLPGARGDAIEQDRTAPPPVVEPVPSRVTILLLDGDRLSGRIEREDAAVVVLDHARLGIIRVPRSAIRSIDVAETPERRRPPAPPPVRPAGVSPSGTPPVTDDPPPTPEPPAPEPSPWSFQIELGLSARSGPVDEGRANLGFVATRSTDANTLRLDTSYMGAMVDDVTTESRFTSGLASNWPQRVNRWGTFIEGRLDLDDFQPWETRLTGGGGLSYRALGFRPAGAPKPAAPEGEPPPLGPTELNFRLGGGFRREWGSEDDELNPEALLGADLFMPLTASQRLTAGSTLYPDLGRSDAYRLVSNLDWTIDLDDPGGLSLKLGVRHEYESEVTGEATPSDLAAFASLVLDF